MHIVFDCLKKNDPFFNNFIPGRSGKSKVKNGGDRDSSTTYSASGATNSASYAASHASNYDQYGSRYNYGNYGQYYQGYSY